MGDTKKPIEIVVEFKGERYHFEVHNKSKLESPILLRVNGKPIILNKGEWEEAGAIIQLCSSTLQNQNWYS